MIDINTTVIVEPVIQPKEYIPENEEQRKWEEEFITSGGKERECWVKQFNNSLPQKKWFDKEFQMEMSIPIGGILDSEYMCFVYENTDVYGRIKRLRKIYKFKMKEEE